MCMCMIHANLSNSALSNKKSIFVVIPQADADFIMQNILPKLSEKGTMQETRETAVINILQDFLQEIESAGMCDMISSF